jgi:hypothetical protein
LGESEVTRGEESGGKRKDGSGEFDYEISFLKVDHGLTPVRNARAGDIL